MPGSKADSLPIVSRSDYDLAESDHLIWAIGCREHPPATTLGMKAAVDFVLPIDFAEG